MKDRLFRILFVFVVALVISCLLLAIDGVKFSACIFVAFMCASWYDCYCNSEENKIEIARQLANRMDKLKQECTRLSTVVTEIRDRLEEKPRKTFNPRKHSVINDKETEL